MILLSFFWFLNDKKILSTIFYISEQSDELIKKFEYSIHQAILIF